MIRSLSFGNLRFRNRLARRRDERRRAAVTLEGARARAARGAAFLDGAEPGWAARIAPKTLALADGAACVLGQLHGHVWQGLGRTGVLDLSSAPLARSSPVDLGFHADPALDEAAEALDYALLTRAWREEIARRTAAPVDAASVRAARVSAG